MSKSRLQKRIFFMLICVMAVFVFMCGRIAYVQFVDGPDLQKKAAEQQTRDRLITSKRGSIMDRNGKMLAVSASAESVSVSPAELRGSLEKKEKVDFDDVAEGLSKCLSMEYDDVYKKITANTSYEILKRKVEKDEADKVREFISEIKVSGINIDEDSKRYYPYGEFAAQVIGFTGVDNQGLSGVEATCDSVLKGVAGRVTSAKSAKGSDMPFDYERYVDPEDGVNVMLTLDESIQHFVEKNLEIAVADNKLSNGALGIVMDVKTGEILAMANKPSYDLNMPFEIADENVNKEVQGLSGEEKTAKANEYLQKLWRNRAISDTYEPGSTFKILVSSMAIEENLIGDNDTFYCGGSKKVADRVIKCWKTGGHGTQNFTKAIQNSCNPAFIEIGARVGTSSFREYFKGFGFLDKTGIELSGEATGVFYADDNFNEVELATSSFGQGFQITPMQMLTAVCAVANDGVLVQPHIIKAYVDDEGNVLQSFQPNVTRQIVSKKTSAQMRSYLESVVTDGGASNAYISGYRVAGKTGTSEKFPRNMGKYIASFVGFAPADDPQVACLILLDEPRGGQYYGGVIAAPVAGKILEEILEYMNIETQYTTEELDKLEAPVPNLKKMSLDMAKGLLGQHNLKFIVEGSGDKVVNQMPKSGTKVSMNSTITIYTDENKEPNKITVPDLAGCTVSQATQAISNSMLNIRVVGAAAAGNGSTCSAYKQSPAAGTVVEQGTVVTVDFRTLEVGE
ncbi:MAG: stage V sporulation protein D [Eubacteriales bacterium]|nr:stage V sporulation protein D [Eubacteriales bacterium]